MKDFFSLFMENLPFWIVAAVFLILSLVEVSKVKINPLSALCNWLGKVFTSSIREELAEIKTEVDVLRDEVKKEKKERARDATFKYRNDIINAANELRNGANFTRSKYNTLIDIHARYDNLIKDNELPNDVLEYDYNYILERMSEADENGEFM